MRSFESSLERLQTDYIDILLAHDLGPLTHGDQHPTRFREFMDGGYRAMNELRASGVVKAIGLGTNEWQVCEEALAAILMVFYWQAVIPCWSKMLANLCRSAPRAVYR